MTLKEAITALEGNGQDWLDYKEKYGVSVHDTIKSAARDMLALAEMREKATKGQWTIFNGSAGVSIRRFIDHANKIQICGLTKTKTVQYNDNAEFIVTAANLAQKWAG